MLTREMFNRLPRDGQEECERTYEAMKRSGTCRPDEWDHIVAYFYDVYSAPPAGWFQWWED